MNIFPRLKSGIYMAAQSFSMLITAEKKLLFYFGFPALISLIIKLIAYNVWVIPLDSPLEIMYFTEKFVANFLTNNEWINFFIIGTLHFVTTLIMLFFNVALLHHIGHIIQNDTTTICEALKASMNKKKNIFIWSAAIVCLEVVGKFAEESSIAIVGIVVVLAAFIILVGTYFVVPLIAFKQESIGQNVKESFIITKHKLVEIIGGSIWFALIIALTLTPFLIVWTFTEPTVLQQILLDPSKYPARIFIGIFLSEILIRCIIWTAYAIFKVMVYQQYHKELPDAEDIEIINYSQYF